MTKPIKVACWLALPLLFVSRAEARRGQVVIYVQDTHDRAVPRLQIGVEGLGDAKVTDDHGIAVLAVGKDTNVGDWLPLVILHSPPGRDLEIVSPWDHRAEVPSFEDKPDNRIKVVVVQRGDRLALANNTVVRALAENIVKQISLTKPSGAEGPPQAMGTILNSVSEQYGLPSTDVDSAIRNLGDRTHDPYDTGLAALYRRDFPKAYSELSRSLDIREAQLKEDEKKVADDRKQAADAAFFVAEALRSQGKYEEAAHTYQKCRDIIGYDEPALMNNWGMSLIAAGDDTAAQSILQRALVAHMRTPGESPSELGYSFLNYGILLENQGKYDDAIKAIEIGTHLCADAYGPKNAQMANPYELLGTAYEDVGRITEAEKLYRKAIDLDREAVPADSDKVANHLSNLARLLKRKGDIKDAEPLYRQAIETDEKAYGPGYPSEGIYLANLAGLLIEKRDYTGAQDALDRSTRIFETTLGFDHPKAAVLFVQKGNLAEVTGKPKEALILKSRALQILLRTKGPDDPDTKAIQAAVDELAKQQSDPK